MKIIYIYFIQIIFNKDYQYITTIDEKNYVLLYVPSVSKVDFYTLENFQVPVYHQKILPWNELWMEKVDFYEKHVTTMNSEKIKQSFFYYIGMAENSISFYQLIKRENELFLTHNRIDNDFQYWDPTNFMVDYRARDIAEYTKKLFFDNQLQYSDLFLYFSRMQFTDIDYLLFYTRMLYPSYYFDCYDKIVNGDSEECLTKYFEKREAYEELLRSLYISFSQFLFMPKIDWIVDK